MDGEGSDLTLSSNRNTDNGNSCEATDALPDELDLLSKTEVEEQENVENLSSDELRPVKRLKNEQEDESSVVDEGSSYCHITCALIV